MTIRKAKLFRNGGSQAVRIPADLSFPGTEVTLRPGPGPGEVTLVPVDAATPLQRFLAEHGPLVDDGGFLDERPMNAGTIDRRGVFDDDA